MKTFLSILAGSLFILPALLAADPQAGTLEEAFHPATDLTDVLWALDVQPDDKIVAAGREGSAWGVIYRFNPDGGLDESFRSGAFASCPDNTIPVINTLALQTTEVATNIVLGGAFTFYNDGISDVSHPRLARLAVSGSLDAFFKPSAGGAVLASAVQPDGSIIIGGGFTNFSGQGQNYIARLKPDGSWDSSFDSGTGPNGTVRTLTLQSDGKILVGGDFTNVNNTNRNYIARLNTNGTLDLAFDPGIGPDSAVYAIAIQPDKKIVIGGYFLNVAATNHSRIARLNADGTPDHAFAASCDSFVWALAVQDNGKILAGGRFNNVGGRKKIARFTPEGIVDTNFLSTVGSGTVSSDEVRQIKIQKDGKIVIAGKFTLFSGQARYGIARLFGDPVTNPQPAIIVAQPQSTNVILGSNAIISVTATSSLPLSYQWQKDLEDIAGATTSSYALSSVTVSDNGNYRVIVSTTSGSVTSAVATLSVVIPPVITRQPLARVVADSGDRITLEVVASGTPLSYQWQFNTVDIAGAQSSVFTTGPLNGSDTGVYRVVVTNLAGAVFSSNAFLIVRPELAAKTTPTNTTISWSGPFVLQHATNVNGPYFDVLNVTNSTHVFKYEGQSEFFKLKQ